MLKNPKHNNGNDNYISRNFHIRSNPYIILYKVTTSWISTKNEHEIPKFGSSGYFKEHIHEKYTHTISIIFNHSI